MLATMRSFSVGSRSVGDADRAVPAEALWVKRAQKGDAQAMAALYDLHAPALLRKVLLPRLGNAQAAQDALAETFQSAWQNLPRYSSRQPSLWPWLARIAVNKATDMHRADARRRRALARFTQLVQPLHDSAPETDLPAERQQLRDAVSEVLQDINPRYRTAIELRFLQDRSRHECAAQLDVTLGNFDVILLRALRAFRQAWQKRYPHEGSP